jgi:hypothetical protein
MRDDDSPTLGEQMNRGMGLDPGFSLDRPSVVNHLREETDSTVRRAQANVEQQRQNEADVERIAKELAREAKSKEAAAKAAAESVDEV